MYSLSGPYPQLAQHIQAAQDSGLPNVLTRVTDPNISDANRATACPSSYPRPDGFSCDEYPFASTYQGAIFTGGGPRPGTGASSTSGNPTRPAVQTDGQPISGWVSDLCNSMRKHVPV